MRLIALIIVTLVMLASPLAAEIPHQINYQGLLTDDDGTPLAGTYDLTFTIYSDTLAGVLIWTETRYNIDIEDGLVNLLLGRKDPLLESHFDEDERWLEIAVDGSTLSPRMKMTSVPWALRASVADTALVTLGGSGDGHSLDADDGTPADVVYVEGTGDVRVGSDGTGYDVNFFSSTLGGRMYWDESKMAFRAGLDTDGTHWTDANTGMYSFASGSNTIASAQFTTAMGAGSDAIGPYATAIGTYCEASGLRSMAMGYSSDATGDLSLALGSYAEADGYFSIAIGRFAIAAADTSYVIGNGVDSSNKLVNNTSNSLVVGFNTTEPTLFVGGSQHRVGIGTTTPQYKLDVSDTVQVAALKMPTGAIPGYVLTSDGSGVGSWQAAGTGSGNGGWYDGGDYIRLQTVSDSVGIGTASPHAKLHVQGTLNVGVDDVGFDVNFFGKYIGSRFLWDESNMALRAGCDSDGSHWASDSIGDYSFASGYNTLAFGVQSTALGAFTNARGTRSTAMGSSTTASGVSSTSMGSGTLASGLESTAFGSATTASGDYSTSMGRHTMASGFRSTAIGNLSTASGDYSLVAGRYLTAGPSSYAMVIGAGESDASRLQNDIPYSLMVGFNTTEATLFVGGSNERVGVGTTTPVEKFEVDGGIKIGTSSNTNAGAIRWTGSDFEGYDGSSWVSLTSGGSGFSLPYSGLAYSSSPAFSVTQAGSGATAVFTSTQIMNTEPTLIVGHNGMGMYSASFQKSIQVSQTVEAGSRVVTPVLEITGGSDLAEPFAMTGDSKIPLGALVVIDRDNPGRLAISEDPYDFKVAGIVSGAGGINPGITLTQKDALEPGQNVALSGRVYALADAGNGAIKPGDLLTTSDVPGHAMKATDHDRSQGAIIGKAMTPLKSGQGLVLVLVSLQ